MPGRGAGGESADHLAQYWDTIFRFCFRRTEGDHHAAEDLTQEVFVVALEAREEGRLPSDDDRLQGWLFRAAWNLYYVWLRDRERLGKRPKPTPAERLFANPGRDRERAHPVPYGVRAEPGVDEFAGALQFVRDELTPEERNLLRWQEEQRSPEWIARQLGRTARTVERKYAQLVVKVAQILKRGKEP